MELRKRKSNLTNDVESLKETSIAEKKKKLISSEWKIQNYLLDVQWQALLASEFEQEYFIELNRFLENGFKKKLFVPVESLVFNAFNSTQFEQVKTH